MEKPFKDIIDAHLKAGDIQLPPFDKTAFQIQQEVTRAEPSIKKVEALIEVDPALTAQVLKMANTAFFRGLSKVETVRDAVVRLGMQEVSNIVLLVTQKKLFQSTDPYVLDFSEQLWRHSAGAALGSAWLAKRCGYQGLANQAFVAGLLHDIGKLFLLTVVAAVRANEYPGFTPSREFVLEVMDSLHTEQGFLLAQSWNLPETYGTVAKDHHTEAFDTRNALLLLVRMADKACNKMGIGLYAPVDMVLVATAEAVALGLSEIDLAALEIMLEDAPLLIV